MKVVVIGAGIGGLAAAVGLQRAGADVTVFERARSVSAVGAGLSLFGNGFRALDALGLDEEVRAITAAGDIAQGGQRTPIGAWLSKTPSEALGEVRIAYRAELHALLHEATAPGTVRLGATVIAVREGGRSVDVAAREHATDLVVAADGIHSRVRASWGADPGLRYSGYSAWRGITQRPVDLRGEAGETWGRQERFGLAPLRDGRIYWFAVATMPAASTFADEYDEVVRRFAGWHEPIAEVIAATPRDAVFRHDISDLAHPLPSFVRDRTVLLGDAAHAMTPDLGQGANQALEDAATLTRLLEPVAALDHPDISSALAAYDALRRPRTQAIAMQASRVGALAHTRAVGLRDAAMRLIPASVAAAGIRRVQQWEPPMSKASAS